MTEQDIAVGLDVEHMGIGDLDAVAALHAVCFEEAWQSHLMRRILSGPGAFGLFTRNESRIIGFVLCRSAGPEGEILTIAVAPELRRHGIGRVLLDATIEQALALGLESLFLEVAEDNVAARCLYEGLDFSVVGRRRAYYRRRLGPSVDALTLRRKLVESSAQNNEI